MQVNWAQLSQELEITDRFSTPEYRIDGYSSSDGEQAIEMILGEDFFEQAVKHTANFQEGSILAEGVLRLLPPISMKYCYEIYRSSTDLEERRGAVLLMKYVCDRRVLAIIPEFLADPDENIQHLVIDIFNQLCFRDEARYEELMPILDSMTNHSNDDLRNFAQGTDEAALRDMSSFTDELSGLLMGELYRWQRILEFETIHGFELRCIPWYGKLELSFLTAQEDFALSDAYGTTWESGWRLRNLPYCNCKRVEELGQWMEKKFEEMKISVRSAEIFYEACVTALQSKKVQKILRRYNRSDDFRITVINPDLPQPWQDYYTSP